jgi:hypothetical protein
MKKQDAFAARDYKTDADYKLIDEKFRGSDNLEYTVLLGHVMVEDQLLALLAARLATDTMPPIRGFELIAGLALAGSKAEKLREAAGWLNTARKEVGHKMKRKQLQPNVEDFVRAVKGKSGKMMKWPPAESEQAAQLRLAIRFYMVEVAVAIDYETRLHKAGEEALKK